ncbi:hypothetical protein Lal_00029816 [Lupinus albus]|nr:hypothetical protein Lal_00029816 [Lupinus albus]
MGSKKRWNVFKSMKKETSSSLLLRLKFMWSAFKSKRLIHLPVSFMDNVVFKLLSAFEAILLFSPEIVKQIEV